MDYQPASIPNSIFEEDSSAFRMQGESAQQVARVLGVPETEECLVNARLDSRLGNVEDLLCAVEGYHDDGHGGKYVLFSHLPSEAGYILLVRQIDGEGKKDKIYGFNVKEGEYVFDRGAEGAAEVFEQYKKLTGLVSAEHQRLTALVVEAKEVGNASPQGQGELGKPEVGGMG